MNKKLLALIAILGLFASACELRADLRLELNADESGRILITFGLDEEFQALVESGGGSVEDSLFGGDNPIGEIPDAELRTYTEDDFTYYEASAPFADLTELRELGDQADGENIVDEFNIRYTEDSALVSAAIDLGEITGGDLEDDQLAGIGAEAIAQFFKIRVQIAMPGEVTRHDADRVLDDGTLEWDIPLTGDQQALSIQAESSLTEGGGFPVGLIVLLVLLALAGVAVFVAFRMRRDRPPPPTEVEAEIPTPTVTEVGEVASETDPTEG